MKSTACPSTFHHQLPRGLFLLSVVGLLCVPGLLAEIGLGPGGHLEWRQGQQLLATTGSAAISRVLLENGSEYSEQRLDNPPAWQVGEGKLVRRTPWGQLELQIDWKGQEAWIDFALVAAPGIRIADFDCTLFGLVPGQSDLSATRISGLERFDFSNLDRPFVHSWSSGGERLTIGLVGEGPAVRFLQQPLADGSGNWALSIRGGVHRIEDGGLSLPPMGSARADEIRRVSGRLLIKVSNAALDPRLVNAYYFQKFREETTVAINWPDRRPIGSLFVLGNPGAANPLGLFWRSEINADDPAQMLAAAEAYAQRAIEALTEVGAQGFIVWDLEGPTAGFVGDPRMVPVLNPQMDLASDRLFQLLREAGFTPGLVIRPTQVYFNTTSNSWVHGTGSHGPERNPLNDNFDDIWPDGMPWWQFFPTVERMSRKIQYAKDRWGCRIFYIDTNGVWRQIGQARDFRFLLLNAGIMRELHARHPDVLLIPELKRTDGSHLQSALWGSTAPYGQINLAGWGTPDWLREIYPQAFSIINTADGNLAENRDALIDRVSKGDVLMFRGWFRDSRNSEVKSLYEAGVQLRARYP